jgi:methyl-accepting chemotaxis protein-1 (serine sensor receptor)
MNNFKISTRLTVLIGFLSLLLVGVGLLGLFGIHKANDGMKTIYEDRTIPTGQIADITRLLARNRMAILNSIVDADPQASKKNTDEMEANIARIGKIWDAYMATTLTAEEEKLSKKFASDRTRFVQEGLRPMIGALRANNMEEARKLRKEKILPLYEPVREGIDALLQLQLDVAKAEYEAGLARFSTIQMTAIASILIGVMLAAWLGWSLIRNVSQSIHDAADVAQAVAQGDLTRTVHVSGQNEVTVLLQALRTMQDNLIKVVSTVRQGSESVATASAEIASGNYDLSVRTEKQAADLEETAASMEQFNSTVKQNADNAREGNKLAQRSSEVAGKGGEVVSQVVDTMKEINDSSKKIADIISVIDGIAFQTNILALNAAVEAARAGEAGRGFAVVASEVRSLAGRSAEAAKEIKDLISDSVSRVEQGTALVDQAGHTMSEVVDSIRSVTHLVEQISTASHEQSQGVTQVNEAITSLDHGTQQNAALVEEMAAAASSLKGQADELVQAVSVFKLSASPRAAVHAPQAPSRTMGEPRPTGTLTAPNKTAAAMPAPASSQVSSNAKSADDWESF